MLYSEHPPSAALRSLVRCYWTLRGRLAAAPPERILPDGSVDLVFHLADPFVRDGAPQPKAMLIGEIRRPVIVRPSGVADVFGVRFHLGGAAAFVRMPLREVRDLVVPMEEVFGAEIVAQINESSSTIDRIAIVEGFLMNRLSLPRHHRSTMAAVDLIRRRRTSRRVAATIGLTERTLERAFNECIGMSAKSLSRLFRFHAALADPMMDAGYYDDSHFIHDFREFSGTTPSEFRRERNAMNDAFVGNLQSGDGS